MVPRAINKPGVTPTVTVAAALLLLSACASGPPPEPPAPAVIDRSGEYSVTIDAAGQSIDGVLLISGEPGAYTGSIDTPMGGAALSSVEVEGDTMTLSIVEVGVTVTVVFDGDHDDYIDSWAEAAAEYGDPILLRPFHEMNGFWYPWSVGVNGNTPETYVAGWRHVVDRFRAAGADNVSFVWSINTLASFDEGRGVEEAYRVTRTSIGLRHRGSTGTTTIPSGRRG